MISKGNIRSIYEQTIKFVQILGKNSLAGNPENYWTHIFPCICDLTSN